MKKERAQRFISAFLSPLEKLAKLNNTLKYIFLLFSVLGCTIQAEGGLMKVADIMQKKVDYVTPSTSVLDAAKLIFKHKHTGLPVVDRRSQKLVGFITDQDILSQCFPSMKEYVEDVVHERDFVAMEKKVKEIMRMKVSDVMNNTVTYVEEDTPLLNAESIMKVKDIARLPVVNAKNHLVGILTKRDIFRALVGKVL